MGVIQPRDPPKAGNEVAGKDRIQVDGADPIHLLGQQVKKKAKMIFQVEQFTTPVPHFKPVLPERPLGQWQRTTRQPAYEGHGIARSRQRSADPYHPLVIVQIIGHRTKDPLFHPANMCKPPDITHLQGYYQQFYRIFAID
jgi:hypothetical protein